MLQDTDNGLGQRLTGPCCDNGRFEYSHDCQKGTVDLTGSQAAHGIVPPVNGAGIELPKLRMSPGRPRGRRGPLDSKRPSAMGLKFLEAGLDWRTDFALAIKASDNRALSPRERGQAKERVRLWLRLLPYLVTSRKIQTRKLKGRASRAALEALDALEGK